MSNQRKSKPNGRATLLASKKRKIPRLAIILPAMAIVACLGFGGWKWKHSDLASFQKLTGKWRRPDGGYVVEVKSVDRNGKMDAAYFNPKPIHVAKAEATRNDATTKVFIELQDVNYPGSTYNLVYEPETDQMKGIYFQAMLRESFEVEFERITDLRE